MRLDDTEWRRVRYLWEFEGLTYDELCSKYHVGKATISDRKRKEGWNREAVQALLQMRRDVLRELEGLDSIASL